MEFSSEQLEKLSDLFIDLAKGVFLSALAVPILSPGITIVVVTKGLVMGLILTYLSLQTVKIMEVSK